MLSLPFSDNREKKNIITADDVFFILAHDACVYKEIKYWTYYST